MSVQDQPEMTQTAAQSADQMLFALMTSGELDPYPVYAQLRETLPAYRSATFGAFVISRHADVERILKAAETFRCIDAAVIAEMFPQAAEHEAYRIFQTSLIGHNPPSHTRLRRLVSRDFTARRIAALRADVEQICDRLLDEAEERLRSGAAVDLHELVSVPLPLRVLARLLGVPEADLPTVGPLVPKMLNVVDPMATEADMVVADEAFAEFGAYIDDLMVRRRAEPRADLLSALVAAHDGDPDKLGDDELRTMVFTLWAAGFETPAIAIDNGVLTLLRHPEHAAAVREPAGAEAFVDELLRWDTPGAVAAASRYAAVDVEIAGVEVPAGSQVRLLLSSANRDPAAYPDPDRFDPARGAGPTLAFGAGIHYCVGSGLARAEISILLGKLVRRLPGLRLAAEPVRRRSIPLRDFSSFPVVLDNAG